MRGTYRPRLRGAQASTRPVRRAPRVGGDLSQSPHPDRKSTRLNSSHTVISYAVFCLKKKNNNIRRLEGHKYAEQYRRERSLSDTGFEEAGRLDLRNASLHQHVACNHRARARYLVTSV